MNVKSPVRSHFALATLLACAATASHAAAPITNTAVMTQLSSSINYQLACGQTGGNAIIFQQVLQPSGNGVGAPVCRTGTDVDGNFVEYSLNNWSSKTIAYAFQFGASALTPSSSVSLYRLGLKIKLVPFSPDPITPQSQIFVQLPAYPAAVDLQAEQIADNAVNTNTKPSSATQIIQHDFLSSTPDVVTGSAINQLLPTLTIQNLLPSQGFLIRIYSATLNQYATSANLVAPLESTATARPGKFAKFSTYLSFSGGRNIPAGAYTGHFYLYTTDPSARTEVCNTPVTVTKPASLYWLSQSAVSCSVANLPSTIVDGQTYNVGFALTSSGGTVGQTLAGSTAAVTQISMGTSGYMYQLGSLNVSDANGGMFVGASSQYYPYAYDAQNNKQYGDVLFGTAYGPKPLGFAMLRSNRMLQPWTTLPMGTNNPNSSSLYFDPPVFTSARSLNGGIGITTNVPQLTFGDWESYFGLDGGGPAKNLLLVLWGMPYEATSQPTNTNNLFGQAGLASPASTGGNAAYQQFLAQLLSSYGNTLFGLECGNEPNSTNYWTGSQQQLADSCRAIAKARDAAHLNVPVICPQVESPEQMGWVLSAMTSATSTDVSAPITQYCDYIGAHIYQGMGRNSAGQAYSMVSLSEKIRLMRKIAANWGVTKPLMVTEYGLGYYNWPVVAGGTFGDWNSLGGVYGMPAPKDMTDAQRASALTDSIGAFFEGGVRGVSLYGYDISGNGNPPLGFAWTLNKSTAANGVSYSYNSTVYKALKTSVGQMARKGPAW